MKIETFVKLFSTKKNDEDKENAVAQIMKNVHISFADKANSARLIAKESYHVKRKDADDKEIEVFQQNSAAKYMLYSLTLVDLYTILEVDYKKALEQFELINGEILNMIFDSINNEERTEFKMLLDFACDDILVNEYEIHAFIREQVDRFSFIFGEIIKSVDLDAINRMIKTYSK